MGAGPLHGLANQEVLKWILELQEEFKNRGQEVTHDSIREFAWETLNAKRVIPGYGHASFARQTPVTLHSVCSHGSICRTMSCSRLWAPSTRSSQTFSQNMARLKILIRTSTHTSVCS